MNAKLAALSLMSSLVLLAFPPAVVADGVGGNELVFTGQITSVVVNGIGNGTLFVRVDSFDLRVLVNPKTEIYDEDDLIPLDRLAEMTRARQVDVRVSGKFSSSGTLASEVRVLEPQVPNTFKVWGHITGIQGAGSETILTLLGVRVSLAEDTAILWDGVEIPVADLKNGMFVQIEGDIVAETGWVARTIKVLTEGLRRDFLRFEGKVLSWDEATGVLVVNAAGAVENETQVQITDTTRVEGELAAGVWVRVTGKLSPEAGVIATEVVVVPELEIKPDERKIKVGEAARFIVKLRVPASDDLAVGIAADPGDVLGLPETPTAIARGSQTASFTVTALKVGSAVLTVTVGSDTATAAIVVGEKSDDDDPPSAEARIMFAPDHIKMDLNETREVVLLIKPPQQGDVELILEPSNANVEVIGERRLGKGAAFLKVLIRALAIGASSVTAALPDELGGGTAELVIEVGTKKKDDNGVPGLGLQFQPREISLAAGTSRTVELQLSELLADAVTVALSAQGNAATCDPSAKIPAGERTVAVSVNGVKQGKSRITAALPASPGAKQAILEVEVKKQ